MEKMDCRRWPGVVFGGRPPINILTIMGFLRSGGGKSWGGVWDPCDPGLLGSLGILIWLFGMGLHGI